MRMAEYKTTHLEMWEEAVDIYYGSDFYGVERFKAGETTLEDLERPEMGSVDGKTLLHLQCYFGMDTLSWAREGATVTGLDFSPEAIEAARRLSKESGVLGRSSSRNYTTRQTCWTRSSTSFTPASGRSAGFQTSAVARRS